VVVFETNIKNPYPRKQKVRAVISIAKRLVEEEMIQ
jgi:hypothetical protein